MPDAQSRVTVDGVEPTILVKYVENSDPRDTNDSIKLRPTDDGVDRVLVRGGVAVRVTAEDLAMISVPVALEQVREAPAERISEPVATAPAISPLISQQIPPGQSGQ